MGPHPDQIPRFRLRRRASLVAATVALQALVIGAGMLAAFVHARDRVSDRASQQQRDDLRRAVEKFASVLEREVRGRVVPGSGEWRRAQSLVEGFESTSGRVAFLLDSENRVLCHPDLAGNPRLMEMDLSGEELSLGEAGGAITMDALSPWTTYVGEHTSLAGTMARAVVSKPSMGVKVVLQQGGERLLAAGRSLTDGMLLAGAFSALAVLALTAAGSFVLVRRYDSMLERINRSLELEVGRKVREGLTIRNALIFGLAKLADYRDTDTGKHLERICSYCEILSRELRSTFEEIDDAWIERLKLASSMHDIGKVGIPDAILLKPGALDPIERRVMEQHPLIGADTLVEIRKLVGDDALLNMGIQVALYHHERVDGTGYPFGLRGEEIPLAARLVALADVYDAMTSRRVYKRAVSHREAMEIIIKSRGTHLDERIVDAFLRLEARFEAARQELQPDGSDPEKPALLAVLQKLEPGSRAA